MKKVLFVATVTGHINRFHLPYLELFKKKGWKTYVATGDDIPVDNFCDKKIKVPISRSPYKFNNLQAIKQLRKIIEKEHFDIIHCHTPMGGVVARLAARKARKNGTRVIYTAHGFHFFIGAPLKNWLLFYPIEKYLAKYTDTLITINKEDYNRAKNKFSKRCRDIQYVPGVGIDPKKFDFKMSAKEKHELRASLGLKDDDFVMIFPARLDKNKNQGFLIECMPELIKNNPKIHLLLPGQDELNGKYQRQAKELGVGKNVHFLGRRDDIPQLLKISDLAVSSSKREGLPVNLIEASIMNIPIVATNSRGNAEVCKDTGNIVLDQNDTKDMTSKIIATGKATNQTTNKKYLLNNIITRFENIYKLGRGIENYKITIIIPVYNSEKYLKKCVDSVLNQTYKNLEIIIIDDGSTDNSGRICDQYSKRDKRIKVLHQKNAGQSAARNKGISMASGRLLCFIDSDDTVEANYIEGLANEIYYNDSDLVQTGYRRINKNKIRKIQYEERIIKDNKKIISYYWPLFDTNSFNSVWAKIYKKQIIDSSKIRFDERIVMGEDFLFNLKYIQKTKSLSILNSNAYNYSLESNEQTNKYEKNLFNNRLIIWKELYANATKWSFCDMQKVYNIYIRFIYSQLIMLFHKECNLNKKEKESTIKQILNKTETTQILNKINPTNIKNRVLCNILRSNNVSIVYNVSKYMSTIKRIKRRVEI